MCVQVKDPSLLRFMVDLRGADLSDKQLRDDLMTMLIAGHETTAAVLTWALFLLMQNPDIQDRAVAEVQAVLPDWSNDELSMLLSFFPQPCIIFPLQGVVLHSNRAYERNSANLMVSQFMLDR